MVDLPSDESFINKLYEVSDIAYLQADTVDLLESVIRELYYSDQELIFNLRKKHIDRAIDKFAYAKSKRIIFNTKNYFKACLLSAIREIALDELDVRFDLDEPYNLK